MPGLHATLVALEAALVDDRPAQAELAAVGDRLEALLSALDALHRAYDGGGSRGFGPARRDARPFA